MAALLVPPALPTAQPVAVAVTRQAAKKMGLWGGGKFVF